MDAALRTGGTTTRVVARAWRSAVLVDLAARELSSIVWRDAARDLFDGLRRVSCDGAGVSRDSYGAGEEAAMAFLEAFAQSHGLHTRRDRGGNLVMGLTSAQAPRCLLIGSHLDSVPQGGNYDGAAGVVAGVVCLLRLRAGQTPPALPVEVMAIRGEESAWFGKANMGALALFGRLPPEDLDLRRRESGVTLRECMRQSGVDVDAVEAGAPLFDAARVAAYLELHIEQGPVMTNRGLATAVVSAIRGNFRHTGLRCVGEAAHSGATPRWLRRDAVFATADLLMRLDEHWQELLERGVDLLVTAGIVGTDPAVHAVSKVPGEVDFALEVRSQSQDTLDAFYQVVRAECRAVEDRRRVRFLFDRRIDTRPATMHPGIVSALADCARRLGQSGEIVPSGPGHDAAVFANNGVPSGMIFVRNEHGSHNPREAMAWPDFFQAVDLLCAACVCPDLSVIPVTPPASNTD